MSDDNPSVIGHISIGTNDFARASAFYREVLATLGCKELHAFPGGVAFGKVFPEIWIQTPIDGQPASVGNGVHFAFLARDRAQVDAFYEAAIARGAVGEGAPGARPQYGPQYYGCFVRDLDGHKIEATHWDSEAGH